MFSRVLVAVDGSAASDAGLRAAVELAVDQDAALIALHVIDDVVLPVDLQGSYYPPSYIDSFYELREKEGRRLLKKASAFAEAAGIKCEALLVRSRGQTVADVILSRTRKVKADLVVIGTHGRRGLRRVLMGSDAEAVLRQASVPVLLVRGGRALRSTRSARGQPTNRPKAARAAA